MSRDDDIVDYLLGELAPVDQAAVERAMLTDDAFRDEVERMRPLVAELETMPEEAWGGDPAAEVPPLPVLPALPDLAAPPRLDERRMRRRVALRPIVAMAASPSSSRSGSPSGRS